MVHAMLVGLVIPVVFFDDPSSAVIPAGCCHPCRESAGIHPIESFDMAQAKIQRKIWVPRGLVSLVTDPSPERLRMTDRLSPTEPPRLRIVHPLPEWSNLIFTDRECSLSIDTPHIPLPPLGRSQDHSKFTALENPSLPILQPIELSQRYTLRDYRERQNRDYSL
jgi:hypothetical protein